MKFTFNLYCFLLVLLYSSLSDAQALVFNQPQLKLGTYLSVFEDPDGVFDAETVLKKSNLQSFIAISQTEPSFGFSSSTYWLTFAIKTLSTQETLLEIANPRLDFVDLYFYQQGKLIKQVNSGDQKPFSSREFKHHNFVFPLTLQANKPYFVLLKIKSKDNLFLPLTLWTETAFYQQQSLISLAYGIFYGTLITMILINLFIFIAIKDFNYLLLSLFLFFFSLTLFSINGLANRFLWGDWVWWSTYSIVFFEDIAAVFGLLFTRSFLNTRLHSPSSDRYLALLIPIAGAVILLALVIDYRWSILIMSGLCLIIPVAVIVSAYFCWLRKYRPARYFLIAWSFFIVAVITYGLMLQQILPSNLLTQYGMHAGLVCIAIMLSLALTDRFNHLKQQKEQAQLATIQQQKITLEYQTQTMKSIARFVPTQFLNLLEKTDITDVQYGDSTLKNMFIMFADIREFTAISETMTPEENMKFLNSYMECMQPVIEKNQGFVDKFIGDAIMALFPNTADQAVQAAIEMQQQLHLFNAQFKTQGYEAIKIGIAVHGGKVMLGTVGSDTRLETTVIGDTVNLTSRLEHITKQLQVSTIISGHTYQALQSPQSFSIQRLADVSIRGKVKNVKIYQVLIP